jgi:ring-1,2-phenylacetyl-CoA epoxidase subunit PaaE
LQLFFRLHMHTINLSISAIIQETDDTRTFVLEPLDGTLPSYIAGQFITLMFGPEEAQLRRTYSLQSSPLTDNCLAITVKRIDNGEISRMLHERYKVGDVLRALPPAGMFTFEPDVAAKRDIFLIGAGSGIVPLFAILKTILAGEPGSVVTLLYSNRSAETTIFYGQLQALVARYPHQLHIVWLFSNAKNLSLARLNRELLERLVEQRLAGNRSEALFYTCGPADYMLMCRIALLTAGFSEEQIKKETFVLPEDEADDDDTSPEKTVDKTTYTIQLRFRETDYTLEVPYTKSILDVALAQGIDLPYSCRAGMCSSCTAQCTSGKVRMQYNEVLTDREVNNGKVLLCTAHPLGNDVVVHKD